MHSEAPPVPTTVGAHSEAPKNTFTVSGTGNAPPAPVRRGRGAFTRQLRTEDMEKQQQRLQQQRDHANEVASSIMTSATTAVVLQPTTLQYNIPMDDMVTPEDEAAAPNAKAKKNIPLDHIVHANPTASLLGSVVEVGPSAGARHRELFGVFREEPADTTRQLFFRGEKRKRYCMIVGNLQSVRRVVTLKLFGHSGMKPFKLQGKMIRLINLSVGRARVRAPQLNPDGTQRVNERGEAIVEDSEEDEEDEETEESSRPQQQQQQQQQQGGEGADAAGAGGAATLDAGRNKEEPSTSCAAAALAAAEEGDAEDLEAKRRAHLAAGFPAEDTHFSEESPTAPPKASRKAAADPPRGADSHVDPTALLDTTTAATSSGNGTRADGVPKPPPPPAGCELAGEGSSSSTKDTGDRRVSSTSKNSQSQSHSNVDASAGMHAFMEAVDDGEDVDHYFELAEDEVMPLTVQRNDEEGGPLSNEVQSLSNSPVLTSKFFSSLTDYFLREFRFLLSLEDVRQQNVSVNASLGAAYCCLARHGSHSTPLKHATFSQFVERMNDESMQLYFIKDCPACVSRAVDRECGALDHESTITLVKIHLFSNERQSRSTARAVWDSELNAFKLLDMENVGVSFNWTIFSLDETLIKQRAMEAKKKALSEEYPSPEAAAAAAAAAAAPRPKTVAYPFEVEFRAFRRWRQHADNPATPLAEAILEKLSTAEQRLITHGSSAGYEHLDFSHICELDYAAEDINVESITVEHTARVRPLGTDLLVDNTTSLFIENFAAARQLKEHVAQYGREKVLAQQNAGNNNFLRGRGRVGRGGTRGGGGRGGGMTAGGNSGASLLSLKDEELIERALCPASKLTFFRSRGSTIHWKFRLGSSVEENIAPMAEALRFIQQVLVTANDIERSSDRGGAAPEAL